MSLLQDAANYEEQHWRNRLGGWRQQAARDYLAQIGKVTALIIVTILLLDGARRDISHGSATVVAFTPSSTLQTASGKSAPAPSFIGQSLGIGDTLTTDTIGSATLAFPDGTVVQLEPQSQLRLLQSDAFRDGTGQRQFQLVQGSALVYAPSHFTTGFVTGAGKVFQKAGSFHIHAERGISVESGSSLGRYAVKQGSLAGLERVVWWPLDTLLSKLGIMGAGTLLTTDSQRRDTCREVAHELQKALISNTAIPSGEGVSIESLGLRPEVQAQAQRSLIGPYLALSRTGAHFTARFTARDSSRTVFTVTESQIQVSTKN